MHWLFGYSPRNRRTILASRFHSTGQFDDVEINCKGKYMSKEQNWVGGDFRLLVPLEIKPSTISWRQIWAWTDPLRTVACQWISRSEALSHLFIYRGTRREFINAKYVQHRFIQKAVGDEQALLRVSFCLLRVHSRLVVVVVRPSLLVVSSQSRLVEGHIRPIAGVRRGRRLVRSSSWFGRWGRIGVRVESQ